MVEIRAARAEEMPEVAQQASRQLGLPLSMFQGMHPDWTLCAFEDGRVATTYAAWPLQIRFNGPPAPISGVTWVSTHPAYRRRGFLRAITTRHFETLHEQRQVAMAGLHPAWMAIYQRYGYGTINIRHSYRIDPRQLIFVHPSEVRGTIREVDLETEFGLLVDVYRRFREDRTALVHRGRAMWDAGPLSDPPPGHRRTILAYEEAGDPMGYVVYHAGPGGFTGPGPGHYVAIMDYFALTPAAHRALWSVLATYDNAREIRWDNAPVDDPLPNMIAEPRMLDIRARDGIMARLVTLEDALTQRPYPERASLRFELRDDLCPWNAGRWELETDPEASRVTRVDGGDVDFTLTPDTLASMVWGRLSASDADRAGLLDVADDRALARWDAALRTKHRPYEAEHTW
ncbi:MAG: GNAT family N-acetyltransferase [Chloroflexi bacterium]|nr:GNAT family N-acetyltransferase [Chloroflexota bacterium]